MFVPTLLRLMDRLAQEGTRPPPPQPAPQPQPGAAGGYGGYGGYGGGVGPGTIPVAQAVAVAELGAYVDPADPSRVLVSSGGGQQPPMVGG